MPNREERRRRSRGRGKGRNQGPSPNGGRTEDAPVEIEHPFDIPADAYRTNRPFAVAEVEGKGEIKVRLLPGAAADDWLAEHVRPANAAEEDLQLWSGRLAQLRKTQRETSVVDEEAVAAIDKRVAELDAKVEELKRNRVDLVEKAVAAYSSELAEVVDDLTIYQLYDVFCRLAKASDPGIVGGQLRVAHTLGTSSVREAFQLLNGVTRK